MMNLSELEIGKDAVIESVDCSEISLRKHILDMGLTPGTEISLIKIAPMGDPMELRIHSYELTLRLADAEKIEIENIRDAVEPSEGKAAHKKIFLKQSHTLVLVRVVNIILKKTNIRFRTVKY